MRTRLVVAGAVAAGLLTACGGGGGGSAAPQGSTPPPGPPATQATTPPAPSDGPSQGAADARRDGVIAELAALPFEARVGVVAEAAAAEGVWVLSRPTPAAAKGLDGCRLGPEEGEYPKDTICVTEYGEVLLLDAARVRILRAYPLPAVPATYLRLTDDAVWFARTGDTELSESALPDTMVGRIDRRTLRATVRVYAPGLESEVLQPCYVLPKGWSVVESKLVVKGLAVDAAGVWVAQANGRWTRLDRATLAVKQRGVTR